MPVKQSLVYTFAFPPQEHKIGGDGGRSGDREAATTSRSTTSAASSRFGAASKRADEPLPKALIPPTPLRHRVQRDAVLRFAKEPERYPALVEILERAAAAGSTGASRRASLDGSYLFVQGPPGSGKTYTGARRGGRADAARASASA